MFKNSKHFYRAYYMPRVSQVALTVKSPAANAGDTRDTGLIPGLGRPPGGRNGNPLQYSCLGNLLDRGASKSTVHGAAKSQTRLSTHTKQDYMPNTTPCIL